jgi:SAM-dependent methyltransferase
MAARSRFDAKYYRRFYGDKTEQASYRKDEKRLADFLFAYLNYIGQPVRSVLDIGCGLGQWREIVREYHPEAGYTGVEKSDYLCEKYGWLEGSAVDFASDEAFDLVICKDTLQYLSNKAFRRAVDNLAGLCSGALYVSILTSGDWRENCDRTRTDDRVHLRTAAWYRRILEAQFVNAGGGVFLSDDSPAILWELEHAGA